ncbi:MAG TPA: SpoIIE family protein phosphatase [Vicinamibacteria bacterium]|nr:SpoIIE family protein phosphatase [Vicinamibacteria bacterium]
MARHPELHVKPLHGEPYRFPVTKDVISIGRSKRNDLVLADQWLSRHHAEIRQENGRHVICDLESRNGTYVNGERLQRAVPLQNGDVVTLGDQQIRFINESTGSVILTETPGGLDLEGTVVVPTEQLLAAARAQEDTWDDMVKKGVRPARRQPSADDSARIFKQNQMLTALSQASMALISNRPVGELLEFILELAFKVIQAERGVLMLISSDGDLAVEAVRTNKGSSPTEEITFSRSIADKVVREKVSILTKNALDDPRFRSHDSIVALGIRSAMCVPLWNEDTVTGLVYVDSLRRENSFTEDDLTLLTSLANVAAIKIENAKLLEEMIEKKRMERELELASEIQKNSLPRAAPILPGWDLVGTNTPCYTIGGDYFDFIERPNGLAVALGDVSGKGASAALMMMVLRAIVHFAAQREKTVVDIIAQTNSVMHDNSPEQFYVTFFLGDLDVGTGRLAYVNAGHIPPVLFHAASQSIERLEKGGTVIGLFPNDLAPPFEADETTLAVEDVLIIFTDGISEAWGEDEEEFGEERLVELVKRNASLSAEDLEQLIQKEVESYTKGARATDDRTIIVLKRT